VAERDSHHPAGHTSGPRRAPPQRRIGVPGAALRGVSGTPPGASRSSAWPASGSVGWSAVLRRCVGRICPAPWAPPARSSCVPRRPSPAPCRPVAHTGATVARTMPSRRPSPAGQSAIGRATQELQAPRRLAPANARAVPVCLRPGLRRLQVAQTPARRCHEPGSQDSIAGPSVAPGPGRAGVSATRCLTPERSDQAVGGPRVARPAVSADRNMSMRAAVRRPIAAGQRGAVRVRRERRQRRIASTPAMT
jgi:hypothetical protein